MDDEPEIDETPRPPKLSLTPSWVMLGFLLGAATVWMMERSKTPPAPVPVTVAPKPVRVEPSPLTMIEAVFAEWGTYAVWENNVTEVALWRPETRTYSECYEVRKIGGELYFRSIPKLTHRVVRSGSPLPSDAPLQFTETEAHYQAWLAQGREEPKLPPRGKLPPTITPTPTAPVIQVDVPPLPQPKPARISKP